MPGFENRDRLFRREFDRYTVRCAACDGSGQVSECIPAADALADAETLTLVATEICEGARASALANDPRGMAEFNAAVDVVWSLKQAHSHSDLTWHPCLKAAVWHAFRAVPGLRA